MPAVAPLFDAAASGRRFSAWNASGAGPVRAVEYNLQTLRNRCRDVVRNDSAAAAIAKTWTVGLIGSGIVCRTAEANPQRKAKLDALWKRWCDVADADGGDFYALQTLATTALIVSGECFLRVRPRRQKDGLAVPVQFQLIEADQLPLLDRVLDNGNRIVHGIEFDGIGRRVAYWFHRNHPGDAGLVDFNELVRVPAELVSHVYSPDRPGQLRGVPMMAPILAKLRGVGDFDDAVLERQKLANLFTGFVERPPSSAESRIDPVTGQPVMLDLSGIPMAAMEPGTMQELLPGESVKFSEPPDAGAGYADFMRQQYLAIAAGVGLPYELLTGDLRDVSDRALRVRLNQWLRHVDLLQWQVIIPRVCGFMRRAWVDAALLSGALDSAGHQAALNVEWSPPRQRHIQPVQDVQALRAEVEAGFRSRASVLAEYGSEAVLVDAERAADLEREKSLGLRPDAAILAEAEAEKLMAEAEAARRRAEESAQAAKTAKEAASEAKAHADKLRAERLTLDAVREHDIRAAQARATVGALEIEAARVGLAELKGEML